MEMPKFLNGSKVRILDTGIEAVVHHTSCTDNTNWKYFIENGRGEYIPFTADELEAR